MMLLTIYLVCTMFYCIWAIRTIPLKPAYILKMRKTMVRPKTPILPKTAPFFPLGGSFTPH
jgi:hypothetical protein